MYKLLLVTDQKEIQALFQNDIDWRAHNCHTPLITASAQEAIEWLNSKAIDAVGYHLPKKEAIPLSRFLRYGRPSLPIFQVTENADMQHMILKETRILLDRLHADFSDDNYDADAMLTLQRDDLIHRLLAGEMQDWSQLKRDLRLVRARVNPEGACVLYEIDMPQGEVYLSEHKHAQERLERALRNNFFGRYVDGIYYAVAVLSPRHIRLVCIPMLSEEEEDPQSFGERADEHVRDGIQQIKEYLDLDMTITESAWLDGLSPLLGANVN
ncbi:MAG: hypothetical protein E7324_06085 [Clostridiales bacterium]|nr:hypothetical protein [Clostridiales bacterium]